MNQAIYLEIWNYLTKLFDCPVEQGLQNNSPLSQDGIVMTLMPYSEALDQPTFRRTLMMYQLSKTHARS